MAKNRPITQMLSHGQRARMIMPTNIVNMPPSARPIQASARHWKNDSTMRTAPLTISEIPSKSVKTLTARFGLAMMKTPAAR